MIIPNEYYTKEKEVKLTEAEIDIIIDELMRTEHEIFVTFNYDRIIKKLKEDKK